MIAQLHAKEVREFRWDMPFDDYLRTHESGPLAQPMHCPSNQRHLRCRLYSVVSLPPATRVATHSSSQLGRVGIWLQGRQYWSDGSAVAGDIPKAVH